MFTVAKYLERLPWTVFRHSVLWSFQILTTGVPKSNGSNCFFIFFFSPFTPHSRRRQVSRLVRCEWGRRCVARACLQRAVAKREARRCDDSTLWRRASADRFVPPPTPPAGQRRTGVAPTTAHRVHQQRAENECGMVQLQLQLMHSTTDSAAATRPNRRSVLVRSACETKRHSCSSAWRQMRGSSMRLKRVV